MSETTYEPTGEVRIALVLYGGVSLAIYMNGIVQELLALVRASAPKLDALGIPTAEPLLSDGELTGAEAAYRDIAKRVDRGRAIDGDGRTIRTRMVVDLLTGTSAGGINGIFLAKALAEQCPIDALTDLWIEHGDIARLLNDRHATDGVPGMTAPESPESLLSGERMLYELLDAMTEVSGGRGATAGQRSPYVDTLDLWVTATDLRGRSERIDLTDQPDRAGVTHASYELGHRKTFHFRYDTGVDDTRVTIAANDFTANHDPVLAFAARCTSSFPGAFAPARLADVARAVEEVNGSAGRHLVWNPDAELVKPFFAEYGTDLAMYEKVCFADGGYLDNHPVDLIMNTLPKRRASVPVSRRVLLIDPDPQSADPPGMPPAHPVGLLATVMKVLTLPRADEISDDVARIRGLREPALMREDIYNAIAGALMSSDSPPAESALDGIAYTELRNLMVQKDLATGLAKILFPHREYRPDSPWAVRLLEVLGEWRRATPPVGANPETTLQRLDIDHTLRRINFVQGRLDVLMRLSTLPDQQLREARSTCAVAFQRLASEGRALLTRDGSPDVAELDRLAAALGPLPSGSVTADVLRSLDTVLTATAERVSSACTAAESACDAALTAMAATDTAADLLSAWHNFDAYDQATYALAQLLPGENIDLEVHRVSPRDETALVDEAAVKHKKLAGAELHHFGAFLESDWRRNDILWGRLDAAEGIIKAIYPDEVGRPALIEAAQRGIIVDALNDPGYRKLLLRLVVPGAQPASDPVQLADQVLDGYRKRYAPPPPPTREQAVALTSRALRVVERIGNTLSRNASGAADTISTWLGRVLRLGATTLDLALPTTTIGYYGAHMLHLVILAAAIMIVLGSVSSHAGVVGFGWEVIAAAVGLLLTASTVRAWIFRRRHPWWLLPAVALVVGGVVCAVVFTHGWVRLLVVSLIGLAIGVAIGGIAGTRSGAAPATTAPVSGVPVAALAIAVLALVGVAAGGGAAARDHSRQHLCSSDQGWWKHATRNVLGLTC